MGTGYRGTFVISWLQTEVDGCRGVPVGTVGVGGSWSWRGDAVRVDGPNSVLRLCRGEGEADNRKRAARMVRRLVGAAVSGRSDLEASDFDLPVPDSGFVLTDGARTYTATLIDTGPETRPLLMFIDELPPREVELWIVHCSLAPEMQGGPEGREAGGVICFTPGTDILTPDGPRPVEALREGDRVQTRDGGAREIHWIGSRRMTGARLFVMPHLRPVRIRAGALGIDRPDRELLVSPEHRMLIRGAAARALFNTPEVLVAARDLVNGDTVVTDLAVREVTYIHLLLDSHQVLWANGVETESFHPASAPLGGLAEGDRARLLEAFPQLRFDPRLYGAHVRRNLSSSEAAILLHEAA